MLCLSNRGETSGSDCNLCMHRGRIGVDGLLLHLLFDRCVGGERYLSGKCHLD